MKRNHFFGIGTSSYLSAEEARLKLLASIMNLARAFMIIVLQCSHWPWKVPCVSGNTNYFRCSCQSCPAFKQHFSDHTTCFVDARSSREDQKEYFRHCSSHFSRTGRVGPQRYWNWWGIQYYLCFARIVVVRQYKVAKVIIKQWTIWLLCWCCSRRGTLHSSVVSFSGNVYRQDQADHHLILYCISQPSVCYNVQVKVIPRYQPQRLWPEARKEYVSMDTLPKKPQRWLLSLWNYPFLKLAYCL